MGEGGRLQSNGAVSSDGGTRLGQLPLVSSSVASPHGSAGVRDEVTSNEHEAPEPRADARVDRVHLARALALAQRGLGMTSPNPLVGAVVVSGGQVVGEGWHEGPGTPHAEIAALAAAGKRASGATLYVSLEPCAHHGRTPPCAVAIRDAGVVRVVASMRDPDPRVDGRGFAFLRAVGISVVEGLMTEEAERANAGFVKHMRTGRPFVTLKMAASLDGKVADRTGGSRWITGEPAREDVHRMRAGADAVVVGAGTADADDPSLTVRLAGYVGRQPTRVVVDGRGRVSTRGALFDSSVPTIVATTETAPAATRMEWMRAGAEVLVFRSADGSKVPLQRLFETLGGMGVQNVLIEGGPTLAWDAVHADVVDRIVLYLAPKLVGGASAPGILGGDGIQALADALPLAIEGIEKLGQDLKVTAGLRRDEG